MYLSRKHRFICIGIPRTGSRSMRNWLRDNYEGEELLGHHDWRVPDEYSDYFVFTMVRNPYERVASVWFSGPKDRSQLPYKTLAERYALIAQGKREDPEKYLSQRDYIEKGKVSMALYFERLPACLARLPFVDKKSLPLFPHINRGGSRPTHGDFFELFTDEDEQLVWENAKEDFDFLSYERYDSGLPHSSPDCMVFE